MDFLYVAPTRIIKHSIIRFCYNRHGPCMTLNKVALILFDHPANRGVMDHSYRMGIGDANWPYKISSFIYPMSACHLPIAIEIVLSGPNNAWFFLFPTRQNGCYSSPYWPIPNHYFTFAFNKSCVSYLYAADIGNGIPATCFSFKRQSKITGSDTVIVCI